MKKPLFKKILNRILYFLFLLLIVTAILETVFRLQAFDFYKTELVGLNKTTDKQKENVLIIGDSFSAHPDSYVKYLRAHWPQYNFINASVPGTGIKQHALYFEKRVKQYNPRHIIYQFYVGNDFTDISHPVNFKTLSFVRNMFWIVSERVLVLQYINYRLANLSTHNQRVNVLHSEGFSKSRYNKRVISYFMGSPAHLNNTVSLKGDEIKTYERWKQKMPAMTADIADSVSVSLLLIPTCAQTGHIYADRMRILGAYLSEDILKPEYPLYLRMKTDFERFNVINPLPFFQQLTAAGQTLYYDNDPHLNPAGQKYLADFLIKQLEL